MGRSFAIFLDAGFVKHKLKGTNNVPVTAGQISALIDEIRKHPNLQSLDLHRAYFYDARPMDGLVTRPDGTQIDFGKTDLARINKALHRDLIHVPFLSLRFGELNLQGWKFSVQANKRFKSSKTIDTSSLKPDVQQKGVDMRIGLDMASLTLKEHVKVIALVTADSDFIPAMKFARREGAQVLLFTLGHGIKDGLIEHADLVVEDKPGSLPI